MNVENVMETTPQVVNGVDVNQIMNVIGEIEADSNYAQFQFRATNRWISGGHSRSQNQGILCRQR